MHSFDHNKEDKELQTLNKAYSPMTISHFTNPRNMGILDDADGYTKLTGPCGDTVEIWIKVDKGYISDISFITDGCNNAIACCSIATELAKGKRLSNFYVENINEMEPVVKNESSGEPVEQIDKENISESANSNQDDDSGQMRLEM